MTPIPHSLGRHFARLTIRKRIVAFFATLIGAISVFVYLLFPAAIAQQAERSLHSKAESITTMVAHSVGAAIVFDDENGIREAAEAAHANDDVRFLEIVGSTGESRVSLTPGAGSPTGSAPRVHSDWERRTGVHAHEAPVMFNGEVIGRVHLDLSRSQLVADVARAKWVVALSSLGLFLVGLLAAALIGSHMIAPLAGVAATAERIADGDLNSRAHAPADDEIGQLAASFNRMVDRVQAAQERLIQSQKMESIGKLAGGVAHDFNNLLTTIMGSADFLLLDLPSDHESRGDVLEILEAGERAASLVGQLLAFSRQQVTQPKVLNLNQSVSGVEKMLQRLIGESVELATEFEPALASIKADPGHLEQVIVNLAVNARDAMPHGGSLSISTSNVVLDRELSGHGSESIAAGRYAVLSVRDTGTGMDEETQGRVFEPFFTRKGPGEGTGLGLATAYGIVQQAGGLILVDSSIGVGTTFTLYFPEVEGAPEEVAPHIQGPVLQSGAETILLVEDQDHVRKLTTKMLERCGYRVVAAEHGADALGIAERFEGTIDLLLTDVVMPGISGSELVERLGPTRPEMGIVYMSGYTDDQLQNHGVLDDDVILIEKPFSTETLASTVRSVLDGSPVGARLVQLV